MTWKKSASTTFNAENRVRRHVEKNRQTMTELRHAWACLKKSSTQFAAIREVQILAASQLSWPANAGHPGDVFSSTSKQIVMARPPGSREARPEDKLHVRATHGYLARKIAVGRPHKAGDDGVWF
jgi:hypothetical protein